MPSTSKSQQRLFGMVHAYQTGKLKNAPESVKRISKNISEEDARHFAETKHKGLPERKDKKKDKKRDDGGSVEKAAFAAGFLAKCAEYDISPDIASGWLHAYNFGSGSGSGQSQYDYDASLNRYARLEKPKYDFTKRHPYITKFLFNQLNGKYGDGTRFFSYSIPF